jgi:hypothetical protein
MKLTLKLSLIVILSCVFASAQTPSEAQHFAKGGLSFDYPKGWTAQEVANQDTQDVVLSRADADLSIIVSAHKGRITAEKMADAKKAFIDPYVKARANQFVQMGATPQQSADSSEIAGAKAEGVNIAASLGGEAGAAKIYWALLGERVVILTLFGPDKDIKRFAPAWDLVRTTIKIEAPAPTPSPSPKPSP